MWGEFSINKKGLTNCYSETAYVAYNDMQLTIKIEFIRETKPFQL